MTIFYLCRHGETENNYAGRLSGWIDTPLTERGVHNAAQAAAKLRGKSFQKIVSSDMGRSFTTAYLIARHLDHHEEIERFKGLREINYGPNIANMLVNEVAKAYPEELVITDFTPPGGESLRQMQQRVLGCLDEIAQANPEATIVLVSHDRTINALYAAAMGLDFGKVAASRYNDHDFVAKLTYDNDITAFEEVA